MFFIVSKIVGVITIPTTIAIASVVLGAVLFWMGRLNSARIFVTIGAMLLLAISFLPLPALIVSPLENRFPAPPAELGPVTGIIVLGGSTIEELEVARGQVATNDSASRLTTGAALARRYPEALLVFTGGSASIIGGELSEASSVRRLWTDIGVSQDRAVYENRSRNTWENATFTRDLLHPRSGERWLLVTSAMHMPRSVGLFRKAGFSVIAYPTDYRTYGNASDWLLSANPNASMHNVEIAVHEWIGLVVYWLTGKIDSILPAPDPDSSALMRSSTMIKVADRRGHFSTQ